MNETITVAGGCFWCVEAVLTDLRGVISIESGYTGGTVPKPSYDQVCTGNTGHAEAVQVEFNPGVISLHDLLSIFFTLHDPTTLNRQGADAGTQYRSAIFYRTQEQKEIAEAVMEEIDAQGVWPDPIVTSLEPLDVFYVAEKYHQDYYKSNEDMRYCQVVIAPKVAKLRSLFREKLNDPA
jgi:peptide-methionine (S)-S-oxide reductase